MLKHRDYRDEALEMVEEGIVDLPERLLIPIPEHMEEDIEEIEDYVSDTISEDTGFCHKDFGYSLLSD